MALGTSDFKVGMSNSSFSGGGIDQTAGSFVAYGKDWSVRYENDYQFGVVGDNGDRWRTTGLTASVGDFSLGLHFATGDPGPSGNRPYEDGVYMPKNGSSPDRYRLGSATLGYRGTFAGWNSEGIRHVGQNRIAHDILMGGHSKHFRVLPNAPYQGFYSGYRRPNMYTTW